MEFTIFEITNLKLRAFPANMQMSSDSQIEMIVVSKMANSTWGDFNIQCFEFTQVNSHIRFIRSRSETNTRHQSIVHNWLLELMFPHF